MHTALISSTVSAWIPLAPSTEIDLSFFKWVIIIGVIAIALLYVVKRVAEYLVNKKTEEMIRNVKDADDADREGESQ